METKKVSFELEFADNGVVVRESSGKSYVFNKRGSFVGYFNSFWFEYMNKETED